MAGTILPDAGYLARHSATVLAKYERKPIACTAPLGYGFHRGGYNKPRDVRVSHAKEYGFETVDGKLALSGANYFKNFNEQIINLIKNEHITSFKLDGMGNASSHIKGSPFASDFDASIALLHNMRRANPNLFINLTTGTNASPSRLFYADSIWRQGMI